MTRVVIAQPNAASSPLRQWRHDAGLSLGEVADLTGLSVSMVSRLERGQRNPSPRAKVRIARALGVRVRELFAVDPVPEEALSE